MAKKTEPVPAEQKKLSKGRKTTFYWIMAFIAVQWGASRYYGTIVSITTGRSEAEIADLGPDIYGPLFVGLVYAPAGLLFGLFAGWVFEKSFKENSFPWSRRAVGFLAGVYLFSQVASALL